MTPYFLVLISVVAIAYAGRRSHNKLRQRLSLACVALILIAFAGSRDQRVGTDTGTYVRGFLAADTVSFITRTTEVGYNAMAWTARAISDSYAVLLTLIATVVVTCYLLTCVRMVERYEGAIFVFVTLGVYTFFFNAARQGIAAAICFSALPFLIERRAVRYFLAVGVAVLFHHTAVIAVPLYYLATPRLDSRRLLLIAGVTGGVIAFLEVFVRLAADLVDERYGTYAQQGEGGGVVFGAFLVSQGVCLFLVRSKTGMHRERYVALLSIYMMGLVPVLASVLSMVNPSGILRLHMYFTPTAILMWPIVFQELWKTRDRYLVGYAFMLFMLVFFSLATAAFSNLVPYEFNPSVLEW